MIAVETMLEDGFSLRKALDYSGSRKMHYHKEVPRMYLPDSQIVEKMKDQPPDQDEWLPRARANSINSCSVK